MTNQKNKMQRLDILALKRLHVLDEKSEQVPFSKFLETPLVTIIFIRHFGCIACRAHVDQVWNNDQLRNNKNNRIIFIGSGSPYIINKFKEDINALDAEIYTDPSLEVFDACQMSRGAMNLVNLKTVKAMYKLSKKGYSQTHYKDSGTHRQMGGVVVVKKPGQVVYFYASEYVGDVEPIEENLKSF